ncbi:MAG TPA: TPM domain-containing protein, partial [Candidatus Cloacimonadota bacterium]|nr:TPM domain-containing protein [Candidatus Cloacimonadota bacterium]
MKCNKILFLLLCCLLGLLNAEDLKIPKPEGFVNDYANLLSEETRIRLNDWSIELKEKTGVELAIATFPDMGGMTEFDFGVKLYETWKIG